MFKIIPPHAYTVRIPYLSAWQIVWFLLFSLACIKIQFRNWRMRNALWCTNWGDDSVWQ